MNHPLARRTAEDCRNRGHRVGHAVNGLHAAVLIATATLAILALAGFRLEAQSAVIVKLVIVKKPGAPDGKAMATVKALINVKGKANMGEKTGHIATHARQAWIILHGQGALLLLSPQKKGGTLSAPLLPAG
jgi:hypothetical protein